MDYIADGEVHFTRGIGYILEFFENNLCLDDIADKTEEYLLKCSKYNDNEENKPIVIYRPVWETEHLRQNASFGMKFDALKTNLLPKSNESVGEF